MLPLVDPLPLVVDCALFDVFFLCVASSAVHTLELSFFL